MRNRQIYNLMPILFTRMSTVQKIKKKKKEMMNTYFVRGW